MNNLLVGIYTITPLHCGTGQAVGAIDLPIARERHTGHPLIPSTSLKGRLREIAFTESKVSPSAIWGGNWKSIATAIFGPETEKGDEGAGAVIFTDARLLAFPVRSLQAVFYWVTCPIVLERCLRDLKAAQINATALPSPENPTNKGLAPSPLNQQKVLVSGPKADSSGLLVLEDLAYQEAANEVSWSDDTAGTWAAWLQALLPDQSVEPTRARLTDYLVILPDNDFTDLVARTTPVTARIKLTAVKTTGENPNDPSDKGNLWYEETLPPDCLFYALAVPQDARIGGLKANDIKEKLTKLPVTPIQLGGNETVGQGWCHWQWAKEKEKTDGGAGKGTK